MVAPHDAATSFERAPGELCSGALTTPKVAVVMPHGRVAGAEKVLLELLKELAPGDVVVCAPSGSELWRRVEGLGHTLRHFELPKLSSTRTTISYACNYLGALLALGRIVRENDVDLVHSFVAFTAKVVAPIAVLTSTPGLLSVHEITTPESIGWWHSRIQRAIARRGFGKVTAVSQYVADSLGSIGYAPERIVVMHNGIARSSPELGRVASRAAVGIPRDAIVFLLVGRITRWKGQAVALRAFRRLGQSRPDVELRLVLLGGAFEPDDKVFEEELRYEVETDDALRGSVDIYGDRRDVEMFYDASDVVLVPSIEPDPFPTVVLESGLAGRPVIATTLGGAKEAVVDGTTGLLARPTVEGLAEAMSIALDPRWRERAGGEARAHVQQHFSRTTYAKRVVSIWNELSRDKRDRVGGVAGWQRSAS